MYAFLRGRVVERKPTEVTVDVGGIGYRVRVPVGTPDRLSFSGEALLHVHLVVREDDLSLYGFATPLEREVFRKLMRVSGVGPQTALAVLSGGTVPELVGALKKQDVAWFKRVRGVGPRLAQRLVVELADEKWPAEAAAAEGSGAPDLMSDAVAALISLGFDRPASEKRVRKALADAGSGKPPTLEQLVRIALKG